MQPNKYKSADHMIKKCYIKPFYNRGIIENHRNGFIVSMLLHEIMKIYQICSIECVALCSKC